MTAVVEKQAAYHSLPDSRQIDKSKPREQNTRFPGGCRHAQPAKLPPLTWEQLRKIWSKVRKQKQTRWEEQLMRSSLWPEWLSALSEMCGVGREDNLTNCS